MEYLGENDRRRAHGSLETQLLIPSTDKQADETPLPFNKWRTEGRYCVLGLGYGGPSDDGQRVSETRSVAQSEVCVHSTSGSATAIVMANFSN